MDQSTMSFTSDYNEFIHDIQTNKPEKVVGTNMPFDVFVQEKDNLYHWCINDQISLTNAGPDCNLATTLPVCADLVQNLNNLSVLGKTNMNLLTTLRFNPFVADTTANMADRISDLHGVANIEWQKDSETMIIR